MDEVNQKWVNFVNFLEQEVGVATELTDTFKNFSLLHLYYLFNVEIPKYDDDEDFVREQFCKYMNTELPDNHLNKILLYLEYFRTIIQ
jgi:hypothetical protein